MILKKLCNFITIWIAEHGEQTLILEVEKKFI
jgi:hypothetical protein